MVIWPAFRMRQYRVNDHPYHAPQFIVMNYLESHEYDNPGLMVFLCIFGTIWLFVAIAIICDDFFVPSLEAISEAGFQIDALKSLSD